MSLINQVLNDLEKRRAETGGARLPRDVRPLPAVESRRGGLRAALATLAVAGGAAFWAWQSYGPERALPAAPVMPPQVVLNTALPPLALPVEAPPAADPPRVEPPRSVTASAPAGAPTRAERTERLPSLRLSAELSRVPGATMPVARAAAADPAPSGAPVREAAPLPVSPAAAPGPAVIEKSPVDATPHDKAERLYRSALAQLNQGRGDDGLTMLRAALREEPAHLAARQLLVKLYLDMRAWDAAQGVLRDGLALLPQQAPWAMLLARLLAERGDNAGALQALESHDPAGQANADYQGAAGAVLQRLGRHADAAARYERATRLDAASGRWWLGLATAREAQAKAAEAREAYQRAAAARTLPPELQAFAEGKLK